MKDHIQQQIQSYLERANEEELIVLQQLMNGLERKKAGELSTYIISVLEAKKELTETSCAFTIPNTPFIQNSLHIPHGGVLAVILDTAMGVLANSVTSDGYGSVTTQLNIHYTAVATGASLRAEASFIHKGRQTMVIEGILIDEENGKRVAHATGSFFVVPKTSNE